VKKKAPPYELIRWQFAQRFGWSLEYIDSLTLADIDEYYEVMDGHAKGTDYLQMK
jgi:hypothetical protein